MKKRKISNIYYLLKLQNSLDGIFTPLFTIKMDISDVRVLVHLLFFLLQAKDIADMENQSPVINDSRDMEGIYMNLSDLSDDAFYDKLTQLKNEHRKTLSICEKLYQEKQHITHNDENLNHHNNVFKESINSMPRPSDKVSDMSLKPPSGRSTSASGRINASQSYNFESTMPIKSVAWSEENILYGDETHNSALSKIDDMWESFSVDEYAPRKPRPRSASLSSTKRSKFEEIDTQVKDWTHRITIPKPFKMTLRESMKDKVLSKSQQLFEKEKKEKDKELEEECQKKFKAKPVPAHVHIPKYHEIMEAQEARRRLLKEKSGELVKSIEKPFNFSKR